MSIINVKPGETTDGLTPFTTGNFKLQQFTEYITAETRARQAKYADPLVLNYKLMVNYDKSYGLFAPETNINSALGYLKRMGQTNRYEMLKVWIDVFKIFVKDFDFLMLAVEGLDLIQNHPTGSIYTEEDKITFTVRETSDMLLQSLLTNFRQIWFDDIRKVEVLPINLRRFDVSVLVYSAGYYNMLMYDNEVGSWDIEKLIYPTVRKLSKDIFGEKTMSEFNHVIFNLGDAWINNEDSGKTFTSNVSNEMNDDYVKNSLVLNFKFGKYSGRFNNISGQFNYAALLAATATHESNMRNVEELKKSIKDQLKDASKNVKTSTINTLITKVNQIEDKVLSKNSVIGNMWSNINVDFAQEMVQNTINLGITKIDDFLVNDPLTQLNNLVYQNYTNNIYDLVMNFNPDRDKPNNISLISNENPTNVFPSPTDRQTSNVMDNGAKFGEYNIYTGGNF